MRCYICDWSPCGEASLYHETLAVNGFLSSEYEGLLGGLGKVRNGNYSNNSLIHLKDGRSICAHCNRSADVASFEMETWDEPSGEPTPEELQLEELEPGVNE